MDRTDTEERLSAAMEEYVHAMELGQHVDRAAFLARYADVAHELAECLVGMDFVHGAISLRDDNEGLASPTAVSLNGTLGEYRIIREIGRGGMGIVYEARQQMLDRPVALKVLPLAALLDERRRTRFQNEARAAATLDHANIVRVYSVGVERGIYYYAMQLVEGLSLAEVLQARKSATKQLVPSDGGSDSHPVATIGKSHAAADTRSEVQAALSTLISGQQKQSSEMMVARIGLQVAQALEHAHSRGILHRDIKPANILINPQCDAMVTDFGLARLEDGTELTLTGDIIGTLRYASPEQVLGQHQLVDQRADVYSLGATLFEALALRPVFEATNREELLQQITFGQPPRLRQLDRTISHDLETIVQKALEHDPQDRYASAREMADDLQRFLDHRPLLSRRPNLSQRMAKAARRHPRTLIVTMAITLFALIGVAAAALLLNRERAVAQFERDEAFENLEIALEAVDEMYGNFSESWITTDQALSDTQMLFLNRSAGIYQSIARRVAGRPEFQVTAARILQRSGAAHARLGNLREAVAVTIQAIDEMPASSDDAVSPDMIAAYEQLGEIYATMGRLSEAREAFAKAQEHLGNLPQVERREFDVALTELRLSYKQADLCCQEYDDRTVAALGNELIERLTARIREDRDSFELHQLAIRTRTLLACSLRRSGSPDSAREVMRLALRKSLHALNDATDRVDVVKAMVQANQEYAMALHELGVDDEAEKLLRASMQLLRSSFIFDGTPKEFSFKALAAKAPHYQMQPTLFCEYARTQMVLSRVMRSTARMQEGAEQAEEAVRTCATLTRLFPSEVSYAIAAIEAATEWLLYPLPAEPKDAQLRIQWVSTLMSEIGSTQSDASSSIPFRTMLAEVNAAFASRKLEQGEHELAVVAGQAAVALQRSVLADVAESDVLRKRLAAYEQALAAMTANP